jgi:multidrug efflux pump
MAVGTLFTLFVVPSIYMLVARDHGQDRRPEADPGETEATRP